MWYAREFHSTETTIFHTGRRKTGLNLNVYWYSIPCTAYSVLYEAKNEHSTCSLQNNCYCVPVTFNVIEWMASICPTCYTSTTALQPPTDDRSPSSDIPSLQYAIILSVHSIATVCIIELLCTVRSMVFSVGCMLHRYYTVNKDWHRDNTEISYNSAQLSFVWFPHSIIPSL